MSITCGSDKFVTLIASLKGTEPVRRRVRKDVIQSESSFLREYIEDGANEINVPLLKQENLNLILEYLNEGQLTVSNENELESLWNDARILGLANLEKVCIQQLTDTISLNSWIQRLQFSQAEGCHELESKVLSFANDNFEKCCRISSFTSLSVDQMVQLLQLPTVKTTVKESIRIVLILNWIKANEVYRCPHAYRLFEHVDLNKLTKNSLCSLLHGESALRNWRCVAIFKGIIRQKRTQEAVRGSDAVQGQSDTVQGQPDTVQGQPDTVQGQPDTVQGQPDTVQGQPDTVQSQHYTVQGRPDTAQVQPNTAQVQPNTAQVQPNTAQVQPNTAQVQPNTAQGQPDTLPCQPDESGLIQAGPVVIESEKFRTSSKQQVCTPLASTVKNSEDGPPPPKKPRQNHSQNKIESVIIPPIQTDCVSKQKQIVYFSQLSSGARSLNFVIVSAAGAISASQHLLATLPSWIHGVPKLIWNEEAGHLGFLGFFVENGNEVPMFNYMNGKGAPKVTFLPRMLHQRHHHQPVLLNGCLYAFGGSQSDVFKNNDRLVRAEFLDMTGDKWQGLPPIAGTAYKRDHYAAACLEGNIYVFGGAIDRPMKTEPEITDHASCYQPKENRWKILKPMKNSRCGHALAVLGHKIYLFGGSGKHYNDWSKSYLNMKSAEVYDVHTNTSTLIAPMLRPRNGGFAAVEMEGKIYVIGGDTSKEGES